MVIQNAYGWILDVSHKQATDYINLLIKLQDGKVISFKQKLKDYIFYILPKSQSVGDDLYQQLSRNDQVIKKIFWVEKYIDFADKNKTRLIGISTNITDIQTQNYRTFIKKLRMDSRVRSLYNIELSATQQFIYNQLKIALTSKVRIEYREEELLSVTKLDDSDEIAIPPFNMMHIGISSGGNEPKLNVRLNNQTAAVIFHGISDGSFGSFVNENKPDIVIMYADYHQDQSTLSSIRNVITKQSDHIVVIYVRDMMVEDISLVEMVEKARFSYLSLELASKYGMLRLIDNRITFELIRRNFVVPRKNAVAQHHEEIRTLENMIKLDKAGMIISPQIGLHENVVVLDFNDEYANIIMKHNISYENFSDDSRIDEHSTTILPSIVQELVTKRVRLKQFLKTQQSDNLLYSNCEARLNILKKILVCLYGASGSIWNRYSNVKVFEEINKLSREILLKTKDLVQKAGFELIYADTDAVFLKRKDATRIDFEKIMDELISETGLAMTLEFHYKFLVLLYIEADEKMEARKHYYGLTHNNQLITRGIDTRRHDSPAFIKQFQTALLSKLFNCNNYEEVLTTGYQNALLYINQSIYKLMNGEVQITDLVISKLLRQNIEKYRSLFPHVSAAIRLNVSGVITNRGDNIEYLHTDSKHTDPLYRITPAKLISTQKYDREKYLEILLDSAEAVLSTFGFNRTTLGFDKKSMHWWDEMFQQREKDIESAKTDL
jgi:DNA polymerase elongation subunit (family B)